MDVSNIGWSHKIARNGRLTCNFVNECYVRDVLVKHVTLIIDPTNYIIALPWFKGSPYLNLNCMIGYKGRP